ncbi:MAG: PSD1 domain-containing protein [Planctomycetales bacterium]|nr:PSD1 domain-containing protein [Planctomycetales bacterium]
MSSREWFSLSCLLCAALTSVSVAQQPPAKADVAGMQFFEQRIRPVLAERCYACHSAKAAEQGKLQGELLLDTREGARRGGESGPAVTPGDVNGSLLVPAIRHESVQMPPDTKLSPEVIADFVKWIEMGAPDPRDGSSSSAEKQGVNLEAGRQFWAYQPLRDAAPPSVANEAWCANPIDRFVVAALEKRGVQPSPVADRRTLLRRAYFDLWGLPPAPEEVRKFVGAEPGADLAATEESYEQLIDRLLASEHYGERWARHWLDLVRFAESNGYAFDLDRPTAYHYRDFVIRALNRDLPYDRFVHLQIAGDQLEPLDYDAQAATGFLAAGPFTSQQTQKERERSRYEQLDDIVGTIGTSMLGMTVGCARCHDHKFDPLPMQDYYRLAACFAETGFQDYDYDPDPDGTAAAKRKFDAEHQPFVAAREQFEREQLPSRLDQWLASNTTAPLAEQLGPWHVVGPFAAADFKAAFNTAFPPESKVDLAAAYGELKWQPQPGWEDGKVHNTLTGDNSANYLYRTITADRKGALDLSLGRDDAIKVWVNGKQVLAQETMGAAAADQDRLTVQLKEGVNHLLLKIVNGSGPSGFYFSVQPNIPKNIQDILDLAGDKRSEAQRGELQKWFAPRDPDWSELNQREQEHLKTQPQPEITKVFAARRNGATYNFGADTRKVYFLARGNSNAKQGQASPGFLQVLTSQQAAEQRWLAGATEDGKAAPSPRHPRVALAEWLTDVDQGAGAVLARVIVNRLWQHHFGRGIVATPSDLGSQGAAPTHPELLDYLAAELIRHDWKLKPIHKLIMMSSTYRQAVAGDSDAQQADPENRLWHRRLPVRLEAEVIRDALLSVSGKLDPKMYGPGSLDQGSPRRSVYLTVKRSNLIPILQLFDAPDSIQSIGQRDVTTIPPQALELMNSPFVRELATVFARRVQPAADVPTEQVIEQAYWLALSRGPSAHELAVMRQFVEEQSKLYGSGGTQTAVTDFCQLLLCLNEFIFID